MVTAHPAKFSTPVLEVIAGVLKYRRVSRVLDPFAGTGRVHWLAGYVDTTVGVELEPEWANQHRRTVVGNALALPFPDRSFDCMVTSPCYGNRMADHHEAKDGSRRHTYRHTLGRRLSRDNAGMLQWGPAYRDLHARAWDEARRVLTEDALVILNLSNHIRVDVEQLVAEWHLADWIGAGWKLVRAKPVETVRQRDGANGDRRVDHEWVFVLRGMPAKPREERPTEVGDDAETADVQVDPTGVPGEPGEGGLDLEDRPRVADPVDAGDGGQRA